jgi:hypothetical protein
MRPQALFAVLAAVAVCGGRAHAVEPSAPSAAASNSSVSVLTGEQVVQILDETVDWYRTLGTQQQNATQPSDLLILFANRQTADKVVGLAFEIARANAELLSSEAGTGESAADASSPLSLSQRQKQMDAQRQSIQQEIDADRQKLAAASAKDKQVIEAKLPELQGELAMVNARKNLLDTMTEFVNTSDPRAAGANALKAQIDAIAATIPGSSAGATGAPGVAGASPVPSAASATGGDSSKAAPARYGIWDLAAQALRQRNKINAIDLIARHTAALAATFEKISEQPLKQLKAYAARSDALAAQADNASSGALKDLRNEFDTMAWLFKQTSDILVPLTKEQVLLRQYQHNLGSWRDSARRQYHDALTALAVRSGIVAGILAIVFVLAEAWRRAVLRYAHEPRRRYRAQLRQRNQHLCYVCRFAHRRPGRCHAKRARLRRRVFLPDRQVWNSGRRPHTDRRGRRRSDRLGTGAHASHGTQSARALGTHREGRRVCQPDRVPSLRRIIQANPGRESFLA